MRIMNFKISCLIAFVLILVSCGDEDSVPKPKAFLRLDYPKAIYNNKKMINMPVAFEVSDMVRNISTKQIRSTTPTYGVNLDYNSLKATLFLTYKAIEGKKENLEDFIKDAEKLTHEHMIKADEIPVTPFESLNKRVFGKLSEVKGNVASPTQFYATDSVNHFLTGSLYFYAKPNYDSILPAVDYLQKDIMHLMETLEWK